ncbi:hypothetical protein [Magpiepox virus 2]|nr:hypothetical protein [Magpiepox virus 2]
MYLYVFIYTYCFCLILIYVLVRLFFNINYIIKEITKINANTIMV